MEILFRCISHIKTPCNIEKRLLDVRYDAFSSSKYPLKDIPSQGYRRPGSKIMEYPILVFSNGNNKENYWRWSQIERSRWLLEHKTTKNHVVTSFWLLISLPEVIYGQKFIILLLVAVFSRFIFEKNVQKIHWVE